LQYTGLARAEFEAGHQLDSPPRCSRLHGHRYGVEVEVEGRLNHKTSLAVDLDALAESLSALCAELRDRDLNEMMPGVITTPYGVAAWIMERLLATWPVTRVSVTESGSTTATATREVRAHGPAYVTH